MLRLKYCFLLSKSMFQKSDEKNDYIIEKDVVKKVKRYFKWTHGLSSDYYRVSTLPVPYLTVI